MFAEHSPRDSIRILKNMTFEQEQHDPNCLKIQDNVADEAIIKFMKQKTRDIVKDGKIRHRLKSLGKVIFTEKDLIEKDIAFSTHEARDIIQSVKNLGILDIIGTKIVKEGEIERKRYNLYCINDTRVAKFMFPHMSIDDFIEKRTKVCKVCGDRFVSDKSSQREQCSSCDGH